MSLPQRISPRWKEYDYSSAGGYFVAICTKDREHYFGEIVCRDGLEGRPQINDSNGRVGVVNGRAASTSLRQNGNDNLDYGCRDGFEGRLQEMALNKLGKYCEEQIKLLSENRKTIEVREYVIMPNHVHMLLVMSEFGSEKNIGYQISGRAASASLQTVKRDNYEWPKLWNIINIFKWNVTKFAQEHNIIFARQPRYHDHIIRNADEYDRIKYYIQTNPKNRSSDKFYG